VNKSLIICDRLIYGALLAMIFFLPYSFALIAVCQATMTIAWVSKRFLFGKEFSRQGCAQGFNFFSNSMGWALMALGLLIVLTMPFSHDPALTFKKLFTRYLQQIFLMYLVTETVHSRKRLYGVLAVLLLTFFLVTVDIMIQCMSGHSFVHHNPLTNGRVTGPMNEPNDLGTLLATVLPVVLASIIAFRKKKPLLVVISLLFLFLVVALGLTDSRGAWLAFAVSMMALSVCLKRLKITVLIVLMLGVLFWGYGMYCLDTRPDMSNAPTNHGLVLHPSLFNPLGLPASYNISNLFFNTSNRELYWDTAVNVIKHYPWFGCGYNAYVQTLRDLHVNHEEYPHNSLLHITAELGIVGLLLYLWLFVALCLQGWRVLRAVSCERELYVLGCGASCGILAWMIHSLLDTPWSSLQLSLLLWLLIGILMSLGFVLQNQKGDRPCQ
jgi:putative inorganic carbon (HCO3(-)) transporter